MGSVLAKDYYATGGMTRDRTQIGVRLPSEAVAFRAETAKRERIETNGAMK